ncbi:hypothetical protein DMB37_04835 [Nocardia sp. CS682]|nr:hypothetical protein DMB37_04835 [Nocardia sp. CS682]
MAEGVVDEPSRFVYLRACFGEARVAGAEEVGRLLGQDESTFAAAGYGEVVVAWFAVDEDAVELGDLDGFGTLRFGGGHSGARNQSETGHRAGGQCPANGAAAAYTPDCEVKNSLRTGKADSRYVEVVSGVSARH